MIRHRDTGEIYLLSLDTFMIMAILGWFLGMIFIVVNPAISYRPKDVEIKKEIFHSSSKYNDFIGQFGSTNKTEYPNEFKFSYPNGNYLIINVEPSDQIYLFIVTGMDRNGSALTQNKINDIIDGGDPLLRDYLK